MEMEMSNFIPIKSFSSNDIYYVTYENNKFNCTCGLKFNLPLRNKCKHIKKVKKTYNEIDFLFNNMKI